MAEVVKERVRRRGMPLFVCLFFVFWLGCAPAARADGTAQPTASVPSAPAEICLYDQAGLLSEETKALVRTKNNELQSYGIQLAVYTVDVLPYSEFAERVRFLRDVMKQWGIGGTDGRGLILALSVTDADYVAVAGDALKAEFTTEALKALLDGNLESDFTVKSYDTGVSKFVNAAADKASAYGAAHPEVFSGEAAEGEAGEAASSKGQKAESSKAKVDLGRKEESGFGTLLKVFLVLGAVVLLCVVASFVRNGGSRRRNRRTVHKRSSVIRPQRASVTRQETRPTVQIKAGRNSTGVYRDQRPSRGR